MSETVRTAQGGRASVSWTAVALIVFGLAGLFQFRAALGRDPAEWVPSAMLSSTRGTPWERIALSDTHFVSWVFARNARVWTTEPWRLFDAGTCHPAKASLALGEPALTYGLIGAPMWVLSGDPILTYNFVLWVLPLLAAAAMFLLIRDWTGSPAAGIVAGLLYAFHGTRLADITHVYIEDMSWTAFALLFANRWLASGRWPWAIGLSAAVALQIGGSLYPLLAATMIAPPLFLWMVHRHGFGRTRVVQWLLVFGVMACAATFAFSPFVSLRSAGDLSVWPVQVYRSWSSLLPGGASFAGAICWLLVLVALAGSLRPVVRDGDRPAVDRALPWVLLLCAILTTLLATGGNATARQAALATGHELPAALPNLYALLATAIPGLDIVRSPGSTYSGTVLSLCILAGLGAATALRIAPLRWVPWVATAGIAIVSVDTFRPDWLGLPARNEFEMLDLRPDEQTLALYDAIRSSTHRGPIFEAPFTPEQQIINSESVLLAAYHRQPTSACIASHRPADQQTFQAIGNRLPDPDAVDALRQLGFRSIVVHHSVGRAASVFASRFSDRLARQLHPSVEPIGETQRQTAYGIPIDPESTTNP